MTIPYATFKPQRRYRVLACLALICIILVHPSAAQTAAPKKIKLRAIAEGLMAPVAADFPKDQSKRMFICEQTGKIRILKDGKLLEKPFLDLSGKLDGPGKGYSEKGLLGIAFHPKYKSNGRFFVYYSAPTTAKDDDHQSILAEYKVSQQADVADANSEKIIMKIGQPESNHNGGQLAFGPDGYLYIGLGDGGGGGDKHGAEGNGQNLGTWLGKILRISVDGAKPYAVPQDNPFVKNKDAQPEIWAYGLRNPWRFSFDRRNGQLFCGDVGQNKFEEINIIRKGRNYGWRIMEAGHCFEPESGCPTAGLELPIAEYGRGKGVSVTGGYVYRGSSMPSWQGRYIFGDWRGNMYYLEEAQGKWQLKDLPVEGFKSNDIKNNINSFAEDEAGEIYVLTQKVMGTVVTTGKVYLLEEGK